MSATHQPLAVRTAGANLRNVYLYAFFVIKIDKYHQCFLSCVPRESVNTKCPGFRAWRYRSCRVGKGDVIETKFSEIRTQISQHMRLHFWYIFFCIMVRNSPVVFLASHNVADSPSPKEPNHGANIIKYRGITTRIVISY